MLPRQLIAGQAATRACGDLKGRAGRPAPAVQVLPNDCNHRLGPSAAYWLRGLLKLASTAAPFCIRFAIVAASSARPKSRLQGTAITGEECHEAKNRTCGPWCDGGCRHLGHAIDPEGTSARDAQGAVQFNDDHAFNRALLRFEELVKNTTANHQFHVRNSSSSQQY